MKVLIIGALIFSGVASAQSRIEQDALGQFNNVLFKGYEVESSREEIKDFAKCLKKQIRSKGFNEEKKASLINLTSSLLTDGKITEDTDVITAATEACQNSETVEEFPGDELSRAKAERLIRNFEKPYFACTSYSAEVSVAVLFGVGAGGAVYKCIGSDASVRLYAGPKLIGSFGFGVTATVHKRNASDNLERTEIEKKTAFPVMFGAEMKMGTVIVSSAGQQGGGIGIGMNYDGFVVPTARLFNLRSKWDLIQAFLEK